MNDREKFEKEALAEFLEMTGIPKERIASYGRVSRVEFHAYDETYELKNPGLVVMLDTGSLGDRNPVVYFPKKSHNISEPVLSHSETSGLIYVYFGDEKYEITKYAIEAVKAIKALEQEPKCKDCKWWKDSDGEYRRGVGAESQCPINRKEVYEGNGYCFLYEPYESEDKE